MVNRSGRCATILVVGAAANAALLALPCVLRPAAAISEWPWIVMFLALATLFYLGDALAVQDWSTTIRRCPNRERGHERLALLTGLLLLVGFWSSLAECLLLLHQSFSPLRVAGLALVAAGVVLRILAISALGVGFRTEIHHRSGAGLVCHGVYRWLRHPSELALLLILGGTAAGFQSYAGLLCLLLVASLMRWRLPDEEQGLQAAYGKQYVDYAARTPAICPFFSWSPSEDRDAMQSNRAGRGI